MHNSQNIIELSISDILKQDVNYIIPNYQRNYAWGEKEIVQLIIDIADYAKNTKNNYYIGSLVVNKNSKGNFEIIDGQQRFTTLIILACYLREHKRLSEVEFPKINLKFESRLKSDQTLKALYDGGLNHLEKISGEDINKEIKSGHEIIGNNLGKGKILNNFHDVPMEIFLKYLLQNVKIMRIELPPNTDLNHYFEIMNSRGEQLEKHEIIKAKLMSVFKDENKNIKTINAVWEACSDMNRYVQMGFEKSIREKIFGKEWNNIYTKPYNQYNYSKNFDKIANFFDNEPQIHKEENVRSIEDLINITSASSKKDDNSRESSYENSRFTSVVNFPNFLLHVLKIYINYQEDKPDRDKFDVPLDDKRLIDTFDKYLFVGGVETQKQNIKEFIFALLEIRFLFDFYIIKREIKDSNEVWSLYSTKVSGGENKEKSYFINSFTDTYQPSIINIIASMHVSTPTMIYKNWLNGVLYYLYGGMQDFTDGKEYLKDLENFAKALFFDNYVSIKPLDYYDIIYVNNCKCVARKGFEIPKQKLAYGNISNNFVFNYLDYLIWKSTIINDDIKNDHKVTFRSSVEHFYPQNPKDGQKLDDDILNSFGNLCLISHEKNSRLNNSMPISKKVDNYSNGAFDSLKQKLMLDRANVWNAEEIRRHETSMIDIFETELRG